MSEPATKCDYDGSHGAENTEPIVIDGVTHVAHLSNEAWNLMQQLNGRVRNDDESAVQQLEAFWSKVRASVQERITT